VSFGVVSLVEACGPFALAGCVAADEGECGGVEAGVVAWGGGRGGVELAADVGGGVEVGDVEVGVFCAALIATRENGRAGQQAGGRDGRAEWSMEKGLHKIS
jgi:hypothetical protein